MRVRREKRAAAARRRACRRTPWSSSAPTRSPSSARRTTPQELEPDTRTGDVVSVVGRVIHLRNTGKLCFARLREGDGTELQAMLSLADVGEEALAEFKALVDIGDFLGVTGEVVTSRRGELSVQATVVDDGRQDAAAAAQRAPAAVGGGAGPAALRRHGRQPRVARDGADQGRGAASRCAAPSTSAGTSRWRPRSCSSPTAARRRGRSGPTSTPSTSRCCCGSPSSSTSRRR